MLTGLSDRACFALSVRHAFLQPGIARVCGSQCLKLPIRLIAGVFERLIRLPGNLCQAANKAGIAAQRCAV